MTFELRNSRRVFDGRILDVRVETFCHDDGEEVSREVVHNQGAVGVLACDGHQLILVRQPREAVGIADLLEIPAGRLDCDEETPLDCARRELAEEVGLGAARWQPILSYFSSPGFSDELVHLFLAEDLHPAEAHTDEIERIEVVRWALDELDSAIAGCRDAKTLIALLWFAGRLKG